MANMIYFDAAPIIYYMEEHERFVHLMDPVIDALDGVRKQGVSSSLTLLEVLVRPFQEGRTDLAARYRRVLLGTQYWRMVVMDEAIAEQAARIRGQYRFPTPDAIHLATAVVAHADAFLTNNMRLRRFSDLPVVVLGDHAS